MSSVISADYDKIADVLYISLQPNKPAITDEGAPGLLWRYAIDDDKIVGVTIMDYCSYWKPRFGELISDLSLGLQESESEIRRMLQSIH